MTQPYGEGPHSDRPHRDRPHGEPGVPPSWMGAPGYTPLPEHLPPHAPMPGAPPYPAYEEHPPPPIGEQTGGTTFALAFVAALIWAAVTVVLNLVVSGPPTSAGAIGRTLVAVGSLTLLAAAGTWFVVRRHTWPFWVLVLVAAPFYWVLRALFQL